MRRVMFVLMVALTASACADNPLAPTAQPELSVTCPAPELVFTDGIDLGKKVARRNKKNWEPSACQGSF